MKPIRLGILGCGGAALTLHLPVLQRLRAYYSLEVVCDYMPQRACEVAAAWGIKRSFDSIEKMLEIPFDVLVVLTPSHEEPIEKALLAHRHVFTEKPISLDLDSSCALLNLAKKRGRSFEVGLMRLYDPILAQLPFHIAPSTINAAQFYKYDGSDSPIRKSLLPPGMETYTFTTTAAPRVPRHFNPLQTQVLQTLLWSGIHQLSFIIKFFGNVQPTLCRLSRQQTSIFCLFTIESGQQISFNIASTRLPVYTEEALLISDEKQARIAFRSPYLAPSNSMMQISFEKEQFIHTQEVYSYDSPFQIMWESIHCHLHEQDHAYESAEIALKVETLAHKTAEMVIYEK